MHRNRRAKIVATIGPASASPEILKALFLAGADTFRMNFSHGTQEDHAEVYASIRKLEKDVGRPIGVLQDLQGPKIRIGAIPQGKRTVVAGETLQFSLSGDETYSIRLPHPAVFDAISPDQEILIDDGKVRARVSDVGRETFQVKVITGGEISNRKGVNLPGTLLDFSPLTAKDRDDLEFGLNLGVDWVALSFVQRPSDMMEASAIIAGRAGLIAKIEKPSALTCIDDIVRLSDAVMVARGDLGVEIPPEQVPGVQKELVRVCRLAAKPVIVATQMLDSMINAPTPTRAEASDVATAIYDGADAVMLSAESAAGLYPVEAVGMMDRIIGSTERHKLYATIVSAISDEEDQSPPHAIAAAAGELAEKIQAAVIVGFTSSGTTAVRVARKRPRVPIVAITPSLLVARQMALYWGAHSFHSENVKSYEEMVHVAVATVVKEEFARARELMIVVAGIPFGMPGTTNNLRIVRIGE
ncbi:MAG: pyruvate kinase [Xanthobacteraceae bacterium]|nr:pyruvate kinase [Xanthobacteraceae bacterium]